jgi:hypothetical protein
LTSWSSEREGGGENLLVKMIKEQFLMMSVVMGLFAQTQCGIIHVHEPVEGCWKA